MSDLQRLWCSPLEQLDGLVWFVCSHAWPLDQLLHWATYHFLTWHKSSQLNFGLSTYLSQKVKWFHWAKVLHAKVWSRYILSPKFSWTLVQSRYLDRSELTWLTSSRQDASQVKKWSRPLPSRPMCAGQQLHFVYWRLIVLLVHFANITAYCGRVTCVSCGFGMFFCIWLLSYCCLSGFAKGWFILQNGLFTRLDVEKVISCSTNIWWITCSWH